MPPPPPKKPLGFSIPKLNVNGLGLSEIIPEKEEMKQDNPPQPPTIPKKTLGFAIPKLKVEGLGLSEIIPGTGGDMHINKNEEKDKIVNKEYEISH
jgi:hypothetical protein